MASSGASYVYLIQLEHIPSAESVAGDLWLFNSDDVASNYDSRGTGSARRRRLWRCSLKKSNDEGEAVVLPLDCLRMFKELDRIQFNLLIAVNRPSRRYELFREKQDLLKWASTLCAGSRVRVSIKTEDSGDECVTGIVRFAGCYNVHSCGQHFGIELDPQYEGKGTSDGLFKKYRYFDCKEECAVFVTVDKLQQLQPSHVIGTDNTSSSDQGLLTGRSVAEMVAGSSLSVSDRVVWMSDDGPEYGTVRWIGVLPDATPPRDASELTVGVEFDNAIGSGTGRYRSRTLFTARRRHASLVPIMGLMKESDLKGFSLNRQLSPVAYGDSDITDTYHIMSEIPSEMSVMSCSSDMSALPDIVRTDSSLQTPESERQDEVPVIQLEVATNLPSVDRKGCVLPPSVADADALCSINRGIQSYSEKLAVESVIFVLFAFYSHFDWELFAKPTDNLVGAVKTVLLEQIVNPLRATYFVSHDKMRRFSDLFSRIQSAKLAGCATGNVILSDDPSSTISTLLSDLLQVEPLIALRGSSSYVYDVDIARTSYAFPTLQHVMECSVVKNPHKRLVQHPRSVFIVNVDSPRFGKLVACGRIFPTLMLDISGIVEFAVNSCRECGRGASQVCGSCFTTENMREVTDAYKLPHYMFCKECFDKYHKPINRKNHEPLSVGSSPDKSLHDLKKDSLLDLFAIVSFINGHYVSFMKVDAGDRAAWLMYDGMAARSITANSQLFIPEIKRCQEIERWLKDVPASRRVDSLPDVIVKLTSGLRLCFYAPRY